MVYATAPDATLAKAAGENFPVALRLLPSRHRRHLMAVYLFARTVDDIGDLAPAGDRQRLLADLEADVARLYGAGGDPALPAVRGLAATVTRCSIPMRPLVDLIRANQQDQVVTRYQTYDELAAYCELSANPVGRIVLHVFGAYSPARASLSDSICTGLQIAEHLQDVAEDARAGRIYLPARDMLAFGCQEGDLTAPRAAPRLRRLIEFEADRARSLIDAGAPLIGTLRGAARVAVSGYVAGGRAALAAIAEAGYEVLGATRRPATARTVRELATAWVRGR